MSVAIGTPCLAQFGDLLVHTDLLVECQLWRGTEILRGSKGPVPKVMATGSCAMDLRPASVLSARTLLLGDEDLGVEMGPSLMREMLAFPAPQTSLRV